MFTFTSSSNYSELNNLLNHSRSQSDSTNTKSSSFYTMTQPRSENYALTHDTAATIGSAQSASISSSFNRKRSFDEVEQSPPSDSRPSGPITGAGIVNSCKKAKTAPSSPITYTSAIASSNYETKKSNKSTAAPLFELPELPLTPPLNPSSTIELYPVPTISFASKSENKKEDSVPHTPPTSASSSPKQIPGLLKPSTKPVHIAEEAAFYFPDTCYSFNLVNSSINLNESNERGCFMEQQNEEWREYYSSKIKHENSELFKKYKEYCVGLKPTLSKITKQSLPKKITNASNSSKLSQFIENQYNKYNGLVNYPYSNNYTYQSHGYLRDIELLTTTPSLYREQPRSNVTIKNSNIEESEEKEQKFKLPSISSLKGYSLMDVIYQPQEAQKRSPKTTSIPIASLSSPKRQTTILPPIQSITGHQTPKSSPPATPMTNLHFHQEHQQLPPIQVPQQQEQKQTSYTPKTPKTPTRSPISKFITTTIHTSPKQQQTNYVTTPPNTTISMVNQYHSHTSANSTPSSSLPLRQCISCHSNQSPCWRPSWSATEGQLCNSCGLRYKKTRARCLNENCLRIPAKGEWTLMKNKGKVSAHSERYRCLHCDGEVAVNETAL